MGAKQSTPAPPPSILGLQYKSVGKNANQILNATNDLINTYKPMLCSAMGPGIIKMINSPSFIESLPDGISSSELKKELQSEIITYLKEMNTQGVTIPDSSFEPILKFVYVLVDLSTTREGKFNVNLYRSNAIDVVNSICPPTKSQFGNISRFGMDNTMVTILLVVVLAIIVYYLYTNANPNIPTFEQRMSQFGRTIRSLRRRS